VLRIVSGRWAGRRVEVAAGTRPTAERLREALFSIWGPRVEGASVLELFCGSGAVGLEALSRGAASLDLVDADSRVLAVTKRNLAKLGARARVHRLRLPGGAERLRVGPFDLIYADPPYDFEDLEAVLIGVERLLGPGGELAFEHAASTAAPPSAGRLELGSQRRYGDTVVSFYALREECGGETTSPRGTCADPRS
jgi:16S rRNA (guanine966-N2)-methyltransferase